MNFTLKKEEEEGSINKWLFLVRKKKKRVV